MLRGDLLVELGRFADAAGSYYTATVSAPGNLYARITWLPACAVWDAGKRPSKRFRSC